MVFIKVIYLCFVSDSRSDCYSEIGMDLVLEIGVEENEFEDDSMECENSPKREEKEEKTIHERDEQIVSAIDKTSFHHSKGNTDKDYEKSRSYYSSRKRDSPYNEAGYFDSRRLSKGLHVTSSMDPFIVGREIAYRLSEKKMRLFGHIVRVLGTNTAMEIFEETKKLVKAGGLLTEGQERKRSPGGTFIYLLKARGYADKSQIKEIFKEDNANVKCKNKKRNRDKREQKMAKMVNTISETNPSKQPCMIVNEQAPPVRESVQEEKVNFEETKSEILLVPDYSQDETENTYNETDTINRIVQDNVDEEEEEGLIKDEDDI